MAEGWFIDGVDLSTFGRFVEDYQGWDDTPPVRGSNATLLGRHGNSWRKKKYDEGKKTLTVTITGIDDQGDIPNGNSARRVAYEENMDAFLRLIGPRHRLLSVEHVYANGDRRQADCEVLQPITPQMFGSMVGSLSLELSVPGAFWEDVDPLTQSLPYDVATGGLQAVEVYALRGQTGYCADAVVTVSGPCTAVTIRDTEIGSGFSYGALTLGQSLVVDAGAFTATKAAVSVLTDLTLYDGQLLEIAPAPEDYRGPTLDITTTGASAGFDVTIVTRRKWLR